MKFITTPTDPWSVGALILGGDSLLQCFGQLVGAGGALHAAGGAFQAGDDIVDIHALHQGADALEVAVAATDVLDIFDLAILDVKEDTLGTGALGLIFVAHVLCFLSVFFTIIRYLVKMGKVYFSFMLPS